MQLFCPCCTAKLTKGEPCRYETLVEHVMCPNDELPVRDTFVCSNPTCPTRKAETFWAHDGEGPYRVNYETSVKWLDGNPLPIGSFHRKDSYRRTSWRRCDHS